MRAKTFDIYCIVIGALSIIAIVVFRFFLIRQAFTGFGLISGFLLPAWILLAFAASIIVATYFDLKFLKAHDARSHNIYIWVFRGIVALETVLLIIYAVTHALINVIFGTAYLASVITNIMELDPIVIAYYIVVFLVFLVFPATLIVSFTVKKPFTEYQQMQPLPRQ